MISVQTCQRQEASLQNVVNVIKSIVMKPCIEKTGVKMPSKMLITGAKLTVAKVTDDKLNDAKHGRQNS